MGKSTIDQLIKKHLNWQLDDLRFASVKYFAETGHISGNLYQAIENMINEAREGQEANNEATQPCNIHAVSKRTFRFADHIPIIGYVDETVQAIDRGEAIKLMKVVYPNHDFALIQELI